MGVRLSFGPHQGLSRRDVFRPLGRWMASAHWQMGVWLCMRFKAGQRETREFGWGNAERFISSSCRVASVAVDDCWTLLCVCVWVLWVSTSLSLFPLSPMRHMLKYKRKKREKKTKQNRKEEEKSYKEREEKREGRTVGGMMMTCWRVSIITLDRIQKTLF